MKIFPDPFGPNEKAARHRSARTHTMQTYINYLIRFSFVTLLFAGGTVKADFMDRVLVIVNEDVITQSEFDHRMVTIRGELKRSGTTELPAGLSKQLLDGMVADRLQLQEAENRGLTVNDSELQAAMERFASQQSLTIPQLVQTIEQQGQSFMRFRESVRQSLILSRLTDYYARARVVVPDYEIDGYIAQNKLDDAGAEYLIAHILLKDPEKNQQLAEKIQEEIVAGLNFQQAVLSYSEATDAQDGGLLGWRNLAQLPEVFATAIKSVQVGGVTEVLQSSNGLHILKLLDMKGDREEIVQSQVRHILISSTTEVAKSQAAKKLFDIRQRVLQGEDFSDLARIYSDDSVSAANGGDLGWVSPGEMVPAFEAAYERLPIGEISQPTATNYGMHIMQVVDRREKNITDQMIRARADNILRRQRADREYQQWIRELKEQAYIEYVAEPLLTTGDSV